MSEAIGDAFGVTAALVGVRGVGFGGHSFDEQEAVLDGGRRGAHGAEHNVLEAVGPVAQPLGVERFEDLAQVWLAVGCGEVDYLEQQAGDVAEAALRWIRRREV
ncbi:MAG: hypothetical protein PVH68_19965 [Armatimonadota bacterium]